MEQKADQEKFSVGAVTGMAVAVLSVYFIWFLRRGSRLAGLLSAVRKPLPFQASSDIGWKRRSPNAGRTARTKTALKRKSTSRATRTRSP